MNNKNNKTILARVDLRPIFLPSKPTATNISPSPPMCYNQTRLPHRTSRSISTCSTRIEITFQFKSSRLYLRKIIIVKQPQLINTNHFQWPALVEKAIKLMPAVCKYFHKSRTVQENLTIASNYQLIYDLTESNLSPHSEFSINHYDLPCCLILN